MNFQITTQEPFINRLNIELKRAERYRVFISLLVYDLPQNEAIQSDSLLDSIAKSIRAIDVISILDRSKVALLFPETNRQGAEIASKRISELIKNYISENSSEKIDYMISPEMASYPDAAGAKSINDFISEYSNQSMN